MSGNPDGGADDGGAMMCVVGAPCDLGTTCTQSCTTTSGFVGHRTCACAGSAGVFCVGPCLTGPL